MNIDSIEIIPLITNNKLFISISDKSIKIFPKQKPNANINTTILVS